MSHIYRAKIKLKQINPQLMRQVIHIVARYLGMPIASRNVIYDFYGNSYTLDDSYVVLETKLNNNARNIAINTVTGEIRGDFFQAESLLNQIQNLIQNTYIALASANVVQSQFYTLARGINIKNENEVEIVLDVEI